MKKTAAHGPNHWFGGVRKYDRHNATIIFCFDPYVAMEANPSRFLFCGRNSVEADVVIVGFGHWFKPSYKLGRPINESIATGLAEFNKGMKRFLVALNPKGKTKVIWRTIPHTGDIDFITHQVGGKFNEVKNSSLHFFGEYWNDVKLALPVWVPVYNSIIRVVADIYDHGVLDMFSLSLKTIEYYNGIGMKNGAHKDSMHFCSGGLQTLQNGLMQHEISTAVVQPLFDSTTH
jgi:hypothetical protein